VGQDVGKSGCWRRQTQVVTQAGKTAGKTDNGWQNGGWQMAGKTAADIMAGK